jgi:hypothetical protein
MTKLVLAVLLCAFAGCKGERERDAPAPPEPDAAMVEHSPEPDVYLPDAPDSGDPRDFDPADAAQPIDAFNAYTPLPDAGDPPDPPEPPTNGCASPAPGEALTIEGELDERTMWRRIEADGCPAMRLTAREVAYAVHRVCATEGDVVLDIELLGADQLDISADAIADPMLVVYGEEAELRSDPFDCLAINDDGSFEEGLASSSRIEGLEVASGSSVTIVATSYESPAEHGVGAYRLVLRAR